MPSEKDLPITEWNQLIGYWTQKFSKRLHPIKNIIWKICRYSYYFVVSRISGLGQHSDKQIMNKTLVHHQESLSKDNNRETSVRHCQLA